MPPVSRSSSCRSAASGISLSALALRRLVRGRRPDIVHAHTAHAVTLVALAAWGRGRPARIASRRVNYPPGLTGRFKLRHLADRVLAVSADIAGGLVTAGIPPDRVAVVRSAIDPERARRDAHPEVLRQDYRLGPRQRVIGTVGALVRPEGPRHPRRRHRILSAPPPSRGPPDYRRLGPARDAPPGADCRPRPAAARPVAGRREDIPSFLALFEVFVLSSRYEGVPNALLRPWPTGLPAVATRAGGTAEVVDDGVTGLLVPPGDPPALAAAIGRILDDPGLAARLGGNARERVERDFSADRMVEETLAAYRRFLAALPGRGPAPDRR